MASASDPSYSVHADLDVTIETRDGVGLSTDIYRPADPDTNEPIDDPRPVILDRTPYDKTGGRLRHGEWYASRGYVIAIQDVRGRFDSGGDFYINANEAEDGADAVEWLAEQDFCDGNVVTLGTSYGAWVQNALATQDPDGLAGMFVNMGAANGRKKTFRHNGAFEQRWLSWALTLGAGFAHESLEDPDVQQVFADVDVREVFENGPIQRGESALAELPQYEQWAFDIMTSGSASDDYWQNPSVNFEAHYDQSADVPTVYSGGWYDSYTGATCDNFRGLADRKDSDHFLLMGPWTHLARLPGGHDHSEELLFPPLTWEHPTAGDLAFGENATRKYRETRKQFFDHYVRGEDAWDMSRVEYFMMGFGDGHQTDDGSLFHGGEWRSADEWPPEGTEMTKFYAHADGTLSTEQPTASESSTSYEFDPNDPVPTIGGNTSSYLTFEPREESVGAYPLGDRNIVDFAGRGGYDQRTDEDTYGASPPYGPLSERDDVLVYRTPPLEEPVEIAGPIRVRVFGETDGPDTDFTAKLVDEHPPSDDYPNGYDLNLSDSICRARFRGYRDEPDLVEPGEVYEFYMEPYDTANHFKEGHRIRLDVSSSNWPRFDVNHNTGGPLYVDEEYRVAENTVHHSASHPTHVELPIQPTD
ncbi:CocE/NonD family hydrolase [Halobacterium bonnevillei]|uniref:CocE/NonD family hydrolase n=1 Tax=Halobacterium bonnevillei TaxID=2692200 RepID=A0A6B0SIA9_9EURY|nr:CocE/NonD family hydrolase [Halobacterium bonnevillei]MXR21428.1 CocE/NonD family hydrolase [Halobacterium bonnevillei]